MHFHHHLFSVPISQMGEPSLKVEISKAISSQNGNRISYTFMPRVFPMYHLVYVCGKKVDTVYTQ